MRNLLFIIALLTTMAFSDNQPPIFLPIESTEDFYSESSIFLEVQVTDESPIEDMLLYYRFSKEDSFTNISMEKEMFYVGEISESEVRPGRLEYYFFARDELGNQATWPENGENSPESYPVFEPLFAGGSHGEVSIELLNPIADEVSEEASIIILSLYDPEESLDLNDVHLFIDDEDITENIFKSSDMITYVPRESLESGKHSIEVKLIDDGGIYHIKKFKFTLSEIDISIAEKIDFRKKFKFKGNISYNSDFDEFFGKDRPENRPIDSHKLNLSAKFTIGEVKVKSSILMNTHLIDKTARLALDKSQPSNRLKFGLASPFLDFKYGDFSTEFSEFSLKGTRIRGIYTRLKIGPWKTSIVSGNTKELIHFVNETNYDIGYGIWDPEEEYEDLNENGEWDDGEDFVDSNGNGEWDDEEKFEDSNGNTQWDDAEEYEDLNENGEWDAAEELIDLNGNGEWDEGEDFIDSNENGQWDDAEEYTDSNENDLWDAAESFTDNPFYDWTPVTGDELVSHVNHTKGTAIRKMKAFRTELDFPKFNFGISALKSYDDIDQFDLGYDELYDKYTFLGNAVISTDFTLRLNNKKTQFKGETAISLMNDLRGTSIEVLAENLGMEPDELNSTKELFSSIEDLVGFDINSDLIIGSSEGRGISIPLPDMDNLNTNDEVVDYMINNIFKQGTYRFIFKTPIEFEENSFDIQAEYKRVPANFISLGNSSIQTDIKGLKSSIKGRLFRNVLSVSLGYDNEHDNLMGVTADKKLKSTTSTSVTTSGGFGVNYLNYPAINYSIRLMNRDGIAVDSELQTTSNKTITHTISPSYKFDTENEIIVSLGGNIMIMNYNDNLYDPNDTTATNTNFTTGSYTGSLRLRFDSPLTFNMGGGLSINLPEDINSKPTQFLVITSKLGYKFMEKTLSTFLGLNIVSGSKEGDADGIGRIDNLKMTMKGGAQYKFSNNISVGLNIDFISLSDMATPVNNFSELKAKLKFKMGF